MLIPLQIFTHIWLTLTLTTFLSALDTYSHETRKEELVSVFIILLSFCDVHWSMSRPLLSFWFNINQFICVIGWLVLSEKMKDVFVLMETSLFYLGLSHISPTLLGRIVDFPVWCGTRCPFVRKLQMSSPQRCITDASPENRAHFPSSVTEPLSPDSVPFLLHNLSTNAQAPTQAASRTTNTKGRREETLANRIFCLTHH